jgi:hypothetical protein
MKGFVGFKLPSPLTLQKISLFSQLKNPAVETIGVQHHLVTSLCSLFQSAQLPSVKHCMTENYDK